MSIKENAETRKRTYKGLHPNPQSLKKKRVGKFETNTPLNATQDVVLKEAFAMDLV